MKKTLLTMTVALMASASVSAQDSKVADIEINSYWSWNSDTGQYEKSEEPHMYDNTISYYYDKDGRTVVESRSGQHSVLFYDANGRLVKKESITHLVSNGATGMLTEYVYDSKGNVTDEAKINNGYWMGTLYTDYDEHGNPGKIGNYSDAAKTVSSWTKKTYSYDSDGNLTQVLTSTQDAMNPEKYNNAGKTVYTYEGGRLVKETIYKSISILYKEDTTIDYKYDANGNLVQKVETPSTAREIYYDYSYVTPSADKQVKNVLLEYIEGTVNQVYIAWDAVAGAEGYKLLIDNSIIDAQGVATEYLTETLTNGKHCVAVMAVVGGKAQTISELADITVTDPTVKPCTDFAIESMQLDEDRLDVTFTWKNPETTNEITSFIIYADNGEPWVPRTTVNSTDVETFTVSYGKNSFQDKDADDIPLPSGPDCKIYIVARYGNGDSEKSNVVELNIYNEITKLEGTAVESVECTSSSAEYYTLDGVKVAAPSSRGVYLMRRGGKTTKVAVK